MKWLRYLMGTLLALTVLIAQLAASADDLAQIQQRGVLRHLGIPYGNFVTGSGDGLDVEIVQLFADSLGVKYQFVETNFEDAFGDLLGRKVQLHGGKGIIGDEIPVRGDLIASGLTVLPWRQEIAVFSDTVFPTGIWVIARADSPLQPVQPSGDVDRDIETVRAMLEGHVILGQNGSCLDPKLYDLEQTGARVKLFDTGRNLNEMVPAILKGEAEATLADAPDALMALDKWPDQVKVIGPLTPQQAMGAVFPQDASQLREAFNQFLRKIKADGTYLKIIQKYYPGILVYYKDYFQSLNSGAGTDKAHFTAVQEASAPSKPGN